MVQVRTYHALVNEMNKRVTIAVQNIANEMVNQLRYYLIDDFYNMYDPIKYNRTYQLQDAPTYEMLSANMAKIFIDTDSMSYRDATGDEVVNMASLGFHGNVNIFRPGFFWSDFVEWSNKNVPMLLRLELKKQGLNVK